MEIEMTTKAVKKVQYLAAQCEVRYWEDATVNGVEDEDGDLIPCKRGTAWCPTINLDTGRIEDWPEGTKASVHYKVCDEGVYSLLDTDRNEVIRIDGYVPAMMSPGGSGDGDYVIMTIDESGLIADWRADLSAFEQAL